MRTTLVRRTGMATSSVSETVLEKQPDVSVKNITTLTSA